MSLSLLKKNKNITINIVPWLILSQERRTKSPSQRVNIRLIIHATGGGVGGWGRGRRLPVTGFK